MQKAIEPPTVYSVERTSHRRCAASEGSPPDEVMDYRGLSAYLKMAQGTLRHRVMRGEIPYFKVGHSVRFSKKHIDLWLEEHYQGQKKTGGGGDELFMSNEGDV